MNSSETERTMDAVLLRRQEKERYLDKIRGSLIGGAAGDALGYAVEFLSLSAILQRYGEEGITSYAPHPVSGEALISDDTQMTLFTANGILIGETRRRMRGIGARPHEYVEAAYLDWLSTQETDCRAAAEKRCQTVSWLMDVPGLYCRRAPGNTCLSAMRNVRNDVYDSDLFGNVRNLSKGCGGVMRVAPLGLHFSNVPIETLDREGGAIAALTHGHPLGYLPAAALTHIIHRIVYPTDAAMTLREIIAEALDTVARVFDCDRDMTVFRALTEKAVKLADNRNDDRTNIRLLGEGWVAEEALAIAVYCAVRYEHDFSAGIIAAVNHDGDSDSTGAIAGNILGAIHGYGAMDDKWKCGLELSDVILEMADDLCYGCMMSETSEYRDPAWESKYIRGRRYHGAD